MNTEPGEREETPNLTERDKTRFLERGFTVVENAGHSLRLIKRDDARQAISIKWEDLSALRELITLALDDGPMVIGPDVSGQSAKNAATRMRERCLAAIRGLRHKSEVDESRWNVALYHAEKALESLTLDGEKEQ